MPTREELLPSRVPANLSAEQYYQLGLRYRLAGHTALAKEALNKVLVSAEDSSCGRKAKVVLTSQLPGRNVPESAEHKNITAYNLTQTDPAQAKRLFEELMNQYPDFEWPFSNYAWMMLLEGNMEKARSLSHYLLTLNPNHLRSIHLALQIALMEGRNADALELAQQGLKISDGDPDFDGLVQALLSRIKGEPPGVIPQDLSAEEYFELGLRYDAFGRLRLAQEALNKATETDPDSQIARKARKHMQVNLPANPVSADAEKRLQDATTMNQQDPAASKQALEQLLIDYPDFETPALILATFSLQEGQLEQCEQFARIGLAINPQGEPLLILLIKLYLLQDRFQDALQLLATEFPRQDSRSLTLDLIAAQCELGLFGKSRLAHR